VKIGDFGLAKSLMSDSHLTNTGSFMGTPLFASPEQIRAEKVDQQSDVYSVAATLYFLLTGRAPFQMEDSAATLARIVSDPAPPMRSLRPELASALDKVVLRGLERDRKRRWKDLEAFQTALLTFVPGSLTGVGLGKRVCAYYLDQFLVGLPLAAIGTLLFLVLPSQFRRKELGALGILASLVYFAVCEGLWSATLGKRILRLRVIRAGPVDRPGLLRGFARASVFYLLTQVSGLAAFFLGAGKQELQLGEHTKMSVEIAGAAGYLLLCSTMRKRNGFRGLHEFVSGTRVVQLAPRPKPARVRGHRTEYEITYSTEIPEHIGPYRVQGIVAGARDSVTYVAEDATLGRKVWVWVRPVAEPPPAISRRELDRSSRLRWLSCGEFDERRWDAYLAPASGCSLVSIIRREGKLDWSELRVILEEITGELCQANEDGSMPQTLGIDQIWMQPGRPALLLDMPLDPNFVEADEPLRGGEERAVEFLREVTRFASEPLTDGRAAPIQLHVPVPIRASAVLRRLHRGSGRSGMLQEFRTGLAEANKGPAEITRYQRAQEAVISGLGAMALVAAVTAGLMSALSFVSKGSTEDFSFFPIIAAIVICAGLSVIWASMARWTISLWRMSSALVRPDGRPAAFMQRAYHVLLFWSVPFGMTVAAGWLEYQETSMAWLEAGWSIGIAVTAAAYLGFVLWTPQQAIHDRLANVYVVPK
jgi:hypothetical protein